MCSASELQAYAAAGICSDHEALTVEEGRERLRAGHVAPHPRGLDGAEPARPPPARRGVRPGRIAFCTDDRDPEDIADAGHINGMVREAVAAGIAPEDALVMASHHPGALARPRTTTARSRPATSRTCSLLPDLVSFQPTTVLKRGRPIEDVPRVEIPDWVRQSRAHRARRAGRLRDPVERRRRIARSASIPDQVVTESLVREPVVEGGLAVADADRDLAKIAVVERHLATGRDRARLRLGIGARSAARSRRAWRTTRTTSSSSA